MSIAENIQSAALHIMPRVQRLHNDIVYSIVLQELKSSHELLHVTEVQYDTLLQCYLH